MFSLYDDQHSLKLPRAERVWRKHKGNDYERRLKKDEENRECAHRFAHFTSRARDLECVWASKHASHMIRKQSNSQVNQLKKKHIKVIKVCQIDIGLC